MLQDLSQSFRALPSGNPLEQPCQPSENPVLPSSFTQINPLYCTELLARKIDGEAPLVTDPLCANSTPFIIHPCALGVRGLQHYFRRSIDNPCSSGSVTYPGLSPTSCPTRGPGTPCSGRNWHRWRGPSQLLSQMERIVTIVVTNGGDRHDSCQIMLRLGSK